MRNNTFLVITILLVGGLFCWGIKKWGNSSFPDQRGLQLAPTSNIQYRGSQPRRNEAATRQTIGTPSYRPQAATRLTTIRGTSYSPHRDEVATRLAIGSASTGSYTLHSSAASSLHSVGGGNSISASGLQGQKRASGNAAGGSTYAGVASLLMPTLAFNTLSAADATNPATTRSTIRSIQRIGYTTTDSNNSGDTRRKVYRPGVSEEDEGWYWDEEKGGWYEIPTGTSNIGGLGEGTFTGQQVLHNGDLYQWNGTEWVKISEDPSEVDYPVGDGAWLLLLLALAYAARRVFNGENGEFFNGGNGEK